MSRTIRVYESVEYDLDVPDNITDDELADFVEAHPDDGYNHAVTARTT